MAKYALSNGPATLLLVVGLYKCEYQQSQSMQTVQVILKNLQYLACIL